MGRLRAAWCVLMGQRVTPQQILHDWAEYQLIFNDLLTRWSAQLARDARQEQIRIKALGVVPTVQPVAPPNMKTELRRKVASMRGFGLVDDSQNKEVTHEPSA